VIRIALIKKNQEEQHHYKKKSSAKRTYQIKSATLVPNFAARCRAIRNYLGGKTINKTKQEKATIERKHHTPITGRRDQANTELSNQNNYNFQTNFNKTASA
jgi:hypothetical protein